jgi:hypothetical protein
MAIYKTRLQSEKEIERMLEESGSEGDDDISSESDSDSDTTPPPQKITKEEGWKWIVTGDRPSNCILQEILG